MKRLPATGRFRDSLHPVGSVAFLFTIFWVLLIVGHRSQLDEDTAPLQSAYPERLRQQAAAVIRLSLHRDVTQEVVRHLVEKYPTGPGTFLRRLAYLTLIECRFTESETANLFLSVASIPSGNDRRISGFARASEFAFGTPVEALTLGEVALLCYAAYEEGTSKIFDPQSALLTRNALLEKLGRAGFLSADVLVKESRRPLVLRPDHRPIH